VACVFAFPDLETALRGMMSAGPLVAAAQRVGDETVEHVVAAALPNVAAALPNFV